MEMTFDEAIGIGRQISPVQRRMILDIDTWPDSDVTTYNREELVWKQLIVRTSRAAQYSLTDRGEAVALALRMNALTKRELLETYREADPASLRGIAALSEIRERKIEL